MNNVKNHIKKKVQDAADIMRRIMQNDLLLERTALVSSAIIDVFRGGGKVLFCGNGGSAADAQHLAAELSGRFYYDRAPLFAEALHVNTSYLTAVANDYSFDDVYVRLVKAKGRQGDALVGISTSGKSANIINALKYADSIGMITVGLTGAGGGAMSGLCRHLLDVPSGDTPRIQEMHIMLGHIICELVEKELFPPPPGIMV